MTDTYEIRLCLECGLRYPLMQGHPFGARCPVCMGSTRVILSRELDADPKRDTPSERKAMTYSVLLDNIRSAWNVGSIFRSADGFGFRHAYLCGITPTPDQEAVQKTSLGAEELVTWSYHKDALKLVKGLKKEGWKVWALEEDKRAKAIMKACVERSRNNDGKRMKSNTVLILGSEVTGVDPELLDLCDRILCIPMRGGKKSFNVAVAFGIACYALTNR